jgi:hypothetical protein
MSSPLPPRPFPSLAQPLATALFFAAVILATPSAARACPFCSAVSLTFAQEIAQSQAAVIARLVEPPPPGSLSPRADGPLPKGRFAVVDVLKGGDLVAEAGLSPGGGEIETIMLEEKPVGSLFLLMGVEPPNLVWSSPIGVSDRAVAYIKRLADLPEKGPDRLAFFQEHLEDEDDTLARDAYDEFAIAPYDDVRGLEDRMDPATLLGWIENPKVQPNRRRLYATMLGVCGGEADAERIGRLLTDEGLPPELVEARSGLDALIACYVTLQGPAGLDLVDRLFLRRGEAEKEIPFAETYAAVMALRFLGEESDIVPRERVLASLRLLLDEPKLADLVIADLARWEDWSVVDRLVTLFKEAEADNIFVREPVVNYLRACPLPEAAAAVIELEAIDPEAVRRAATLAGLAAVTAAAPAGASGVDGVGTDDSGDIGASLPTVSVGNSPTGSAAGVPTPAELALAKRIAPVIGDDESIVPGGPAAARTPAVETPAGSSAWTWAVWAAAVVFVAIVSRAVLRPARSTPAR